MRTFSTGLNTGILRAMDIYEIRKHNLVKLIGSQRKGSCAERWGMAPAHLSQILSDKTAKNLGDDVARRIEEVEGLPRGWFDSIPSGDDGQPLAEVVDSKLSAADLVKQMLAKSGRGIPEETRQRLLAAAEEPAPAVAPADSGVVKADFNRPGLVGDEVWIAHYDVRGAMGGGEQTHDFPEMLQDVRVSPRHLRELGVEFKEHYHLKLVTGWGQSMAPTIKNRDPLIVDVSIREFAGDGIYYFSWGGHEYIKRLQIADEEHFEMISDNPKHKDRLIRREETYIQARVLLVWNAHLV
ncbi:Phage repressor protein C, contains Cro/C1-type HTH and peptisase s24 domains [Pseudomonas sp. URMO17WK12:I5]|nr:phage repressor protein C with HTH and peptisase S24 domain [Pseudomonas sp. URMO17WK12:I7]SME90765.1 Phage repressor protein C, contains Cro/C1-type HTH and peptisase s24 domains [Pseudomonas sp. URMO17WK12:I5]